MLWAHLAVLLHVFFKVGRVSELPIAVGTSEPENEVQEKIFRLVVGGIGGMVTLIFIVEDVDILFKRQ